MVRLRMAATSLLALLLAASVPATAATQTLFSRGMAGEGIPAGGPYVPPGSLYDNEQSDGSTSLASQDSSGTLTARTADDFIVPAGNCASGLFDVTQIRMQMVQNDNAPQPFSVDIYNDDGSGNSPAPSNAIAPIATFAETTQTNLGVFGIGTSIFEVNLATPGLQITADTKYWLSGFGATASANAGSFNNFFAASAGAAATTDNGVIIAPGSGVAVWTPVDQVIGGNPLAFSFAIDGACSAPTVNVIEVPTVSSLGLAALVLLLMGSAFFLLRRART